MKINIDGYEVNITAKASYHDKASKRDAMNVLNRISIWTMDAANAPGNESIAHIYKRVSREIYEQLKAAGCYDNVKIGG